MTNSQGVSEIKIFYKYKTLRSNIIVIIATYVINSQLRSACSKTMLGVIIESAYLFRGFVEILIELYNQKWIVQTNSIQNLRCANCNRIGYTGIKSSS